MFMPNFTQPQHFVEIWTQAAEANLERLEQLSEQLAKVQGQGVERARAAIDESAELMKESMTYALTLGDEWRKLGFEMTKKATTSSG
jgi:hypothetical protein